MQEMFNFLMSSQATIIAMLMSAWVGISLVTFEKPDFHCPRNVWVRRVEHLFTVAVFIVLFFSPRIQDPFADMFPFLSYFAYVMVCFMTGVAGAVAAALVKWILCLKG